MPSCTLCALSCSSDDALAWRQGRLRPAAVSAHVLVFQRCCCLCRRLVAVVPSTGVTQCVCNMPGDWAEGWNLPRLRTVMGLHYGFTAPTQCIKYLLGSHDQVPAGPCAWFPATPAECAFVNRIMLGGRA